MADAIRKFPLSFRENTDDNMDLIFLCFAQNPPLNSKSRGQSPHRARREAHAPRPREHNSRAPQQTFAYHRGQARGEAGAAEAGRVSASPVRPVTFETTVSLQYPFCAIDCSCSKDRKSTRLNSSHSQIYHNFFS